MTSIPPRGTAPVPGAGAYFEGTNILVKVPGSDKHDSNAVLFSAHYDSVSSAPGATDNGIGVVAALHFLEWATTISNCCDALTYPYQIPREHAPGQAAS
jgi:exosome complex RNA-binding protein Rrp4